MLSERQIIKGCKKHQVEAQKALYEKFSPVLRGICLRYTSCAQEASDVLHDCFMKIFKVIEQYEGKGSFEGWLKRIVINASISYYKKKQKTRHYDIDEIKEINIENQDDEEDDESMKGIVNKADFSKEEMLEIIQQLPEGYKMVFNLYAVEGYSHAQIAKELEVSVNTSKSQLARARKHIQKLLYEAACKKLNINQKTTKNIFTYLIFFLTYCWLNF